MILYHATLSSNEPSIRQHGLLTDRSLGVMRVVWLHAADRSAWAVLHTLRRHGGRAEEVVVLECHVDERFVRRFASGLYYHVCDVVPVDVVRSIGFEEISRSPIE